MSIRQASGADLDRILAFRPDIANPDYPIREQDLFRTRSGYSPGTYRFSGVEQAAGMYEGSLGAVSGRLLSRMSDPAGTTILHLHADGQNFTALIQGDLFASCQPEFPERQHAARVCGISTVAPKERSGSSFTLSSLTLLVQFNADVTLLSGPSWLQGWRLVWLIRAGPLISCSGVYLIMHASRARMRAIAEERERLSHEVHDTPAQSFAGNDFVDLVELLSEQVWRYPVFTRPLAQALQAKADRYRSALQMWMNCKVQRRTAFDLPNLTALHSSGPLFLGIAPAVLNLDELGMGGNLSVNELYCGTWARWISILQPIWRSSRTGYPDAHKSSVRKLPSVHYAR